MPDLHSISASADSSKHYRATRADVRRDEVTPDSEVTR